MTKDEFESKYPLIMGWINQTIADHAGGAWSIASLGFPRLSQYFHPQLLATSRVVYVASVPIPPLTAMGLDQFADIESMDLGGITFLNTFFSRLEMQYNEAHHFHELIHVIQWRILGPKLFMEAYAHGLTRIEYRQTPLEVMAYTLESVFRNSTTPFNVDKVVREQLGELYVQCR